MRTIYSTIIFTLLMIGVAFSFQTSSESINPFNQFMSPSGGINAFSGDVAYSHQIATLTGRNGMNIGVGLSYSSNVHINIRARNDIAPSGWCGMGWNLNYGSIRCNHKGTKTHDDDDFIWLSPAGFGSKIIEKDGKYFIQQDPYSKIEPQDINGDGVFDGWIVTGIDGKKMKYGNLNLSGDRKATRWTLSWGNYVGTGMSGAPTHYPYAWDLAEIADIHGNAVQFYYQQESENLKVGTWTSPVQYTKASYPLKIVNPEGKRIEFTLESKGNEVYDPYTYQAEPDGFMEMFEAMRLSQIKVFVIPGSVNAVSTYKFIYTTINGTELGNDYKKSLLTSVETYDGAGTSLLSKAQFTYNTDFAKGNRDDATNYDPNYNYGALSGVTTNQGGATEFGYSRKTLSIPKPEFFDHTTSDLDETWTGMLEDGIPYVIFRGNTNGRWLWVYIWNGSKWELAKKRENGQVTEIKYDDFGNPNLKSVYPGYNQFVLVTGSGQHFVSGYRWNGAEFEATHIEHEGVLVDFKLQTLGNPNYKRVALSNQHLIVTTGSGFHFVSSYFWNGAYWEKSTFDLNQMGNPNAKQVYLGAYHMLVRTGSGQHFVSGYEWKNNEWELSMIDGQEFSLLQLGNPNGKDIYLSTNHFFVVTGSTKHMMTGYTWNGTEWTNTMPLGLYGNPNSKVLQLSDDHLIVRTGSDDHIVSAYYWDGTAWQNAQTNSGGIVHNMYLDLLGNPNSKDVYLFGNHLGIVTGSDKHFVSIYHWDDSVWKTTSFYLDMLDHPDAKIIYFGSDQLVIRTGSTSHFLYVYTWDGNKWIERRFKDNLGQNDPKEVSIQHGFFVARDDRNSWFFRKFQDTYVSDVHCYVVEQKRTSSGFGTSPIVAQYGYADGNYDTRAGTAKFNKVETITPSTGKTVQYYFNDTHADNQHTVNANYEKLDGKVYRTAAYNQANATAETNPISTSSTDYSIYSNASWPPDVFQKRVTKTTGTLQGVATINEILAYNNTNGLPYINRTKNSDGKQKLSKTFFAFENAAYSTAMGATGANMLTVPCQTVVYEKASGDNSIEPLPSEIRSAQAATWSNTLGCAAWVPAKTYAWKANFNADGTLDRTFADYNHASGATNPNWQLMGSVDKYNTTGGAVQSSNPLGIPSAALMSNDNTLPLANASNARYGECFFTSFEEETPWTFSNGGTMVYATDRRKNGGKAGKIVNNGTTEIYADAQWKSLDIGLPAAKKFTFSGWVYTTGPQAELYFFASVNGTSYETGHYTNLVTPADAANKWVFLQGTFEAPAGAKYFTIRVDNNGKNGTATDVYYDDLKYYPADAMMSVIYYDGTWRKPVLTVDANENPGRLAEFDIFGRPIKWWKVDKNKDVTDSGYKKAMLMQKEHNLLTANP